MRLKSAVLALSLSVIAFAPHASFADSLTLTGTSGGSTDGIDIYPYDFTVTTGQSSVANVMMSCVNFNREIVVGETWAVTAVSIPLGSGTTDGSANADFRADAWLVNQYNTAAYTNSEVQFAIWSIIDPTDVTAGGKYDGFDTKSQALATQAAAEANSLPASYFSGDTLYIPNLTNTTGWYNGGEPQAFIVDGPAPAMTPEPSSLLLFGTGLLGSVFLMRRRLQVPVTA